MLNISMNKGTGVVTSVPSDAPDDYAVLVDLKKKKPLREKFGLTDEMVLPFEPVEIIEVPGYGKLSAVRACEDAKVASMNDTKKLAEIKTEVYTKGFYKGVMLVGPQAGKSVQEAKPLIRAMMIEAGQAAVYYEPEAECVSRSGDECVVTLCDQWYINYGEEKEREKLVEWVKSKNFHPFNENVRSLVLEGVDWLKEWGCSRSFGLGSRLPWDPKFLIESLSDSTIYMSYYAIAHLLQGDIEGTKPGQLGIAAKDIQDCDWNFIFFGKERDPKSLIPEDKLLKMREQFEYYYPLDLRVSGKDLAKNHLTMALYNHEFIWGGEKKPMLPRGYFLNGWILVDGEKMSKQKGNFILMYDMVERYGADASRVMLACAGDGLADANAVLDEADKAVLKITTFESWLKETRAIFATLRKETVPDTAFLDALFENQTKMLIKEAEGFYEQLAFREATIALFFNLLSIKEDYKINCGAHGMKASVIKTFIHDTLIALAPIIPHFSEIMWRENYLPLLTEEELKSAPKQVFDAAYPAYTSEQIDLGVLSKKRILEKVTADLTSGYEKYLEKSKNFKLKNIYVVVSTGYKDWQIKTLEALKTATEENFKERVKELFAADKKVLGKAMKFADFKYKEFLQLKSDQSVFDSVFPIKEKELFAENIKLLTRDLKGNQVAIISSEEAAAHAYANLKQAGEAVEPGSPAVVFEIEK